MRLILLGPPGSGKGTQAQLLSTHHNLEHIGTGDLIREAIAQKTPLGLRAEPDVKAGRLIPDSLVNDLIVERFQKRPPRFVMDGYPRTVSQAVAFEQLLRELGLAVDAVLLLKVDDDEIVRRLGGRWSCPKSGCKATYPTEKTPPRALGVCDRCGTHLVQRADDRPETVRERLVVYHKNTEKLIPYYRNEGKLREVSGQGDIEQVYNNLMKALQP